MFVRKAKGDNNDTGSKKRDGWHNKRGGGQNLNQNRNNTNINNYNFPAKPQLSNPNTKSENEETKRPRLDSDNFPALPNKTIMVDVPMFPLEDDDD